MDDTLLSQYEAATHRSIVGGLQYFTVTRPGLSFAVNRVCQYLHSPTTIHWSTVKKNSKVCLGYSSSWSSYPKFSKYYFNCLLLGSKETTNCLTSSTESEYNAVADPTSELIWIGALLKELNVSH